MVLVSHIYKFIYVKNRKVAGSSVESFFGQYCIDPLEIESYSFKDKQPERVTEFGILGSRLVKKSNKMMWDGHKKVKGIKRDIGDKIFNEYFKFCVVRNPYDLMVSLFFWNKRPVGDINNKRFKKFCKKFNKCNKKNIFLDVNNECQYYIRYENLIDDIKIVLGKLGITNYDISKLPNHKSTMNPKTKHYSEYYDDKTKDIVKHIFKKELEMFNYEF